MKRGTVNEQNNQDRGLRNDHKACVQTALVAIISAREPCNTPSQDNSVFDACPELGTEICQLFNISKQNVDTDLKHHSDYEIIVILEIDTRTQQENSF